MPRAGILKAIYRVLYAFSAVGGATGYYVTHVGTAKNSFGDAVVYYVTPRGIADNIVGSAAA